MSDRAGELLPLTRTMSCRQVCNSATTLAIFGLALPLLGCSSDVAGTAAGGAGAFAGGSAGTATQAGASAGGAVVSMAGGGAGGISGGAGGADTAGSGGVTGGAPSGGSGGAGGLAGSAGAGGAPPMLEPGIRWLGRVVKTQNGARFSWPGTGFTARWQGTSAKVTLKTGQVDYFQLVVDGQVKLLTTLQGEHDYDLAQNLTQGEHTVVLWRRTEANYGTVEVTKLDWAGGTLLSPPPPSNKRIEVVGDSISVGFGVECKTQGEAFSYATENNYQTYEAITGRDLGAEVMTMAWSGIGMWRDVGGGFTSQMPVRYLRTLGNEDNSPAWDFASYTPAAVVVLLGTNDFAKGDPAQPFVDAYKTFVADVRAHYPAARVYLSHSPMLSGDRGTAIAGYLDQVKAARALAGDNNVGILDFKPPAADAWGCGHPNGATHQLMAEVLKAALKQDLGW